MRKELLFSKMSNRKLKRENGILRRWSANNADIGMGSDIEMGSDIGMGSVYHAQNDRQRYSSQRSNSLPQSVRSRYQYTFYAQR